MVHVYRKYKCTSWVILVLAGEMVCKIFCWLCVCKKKKKCALKGHNLRITTWDNLVQGV